MELKRGGGWSSGIENWQSLSGWRLHQTYIPNGMEVHMGMMELGGETHQVYRCLDDTFFAQPTRVCELPHVKNPMTVVYEVKMSNNEVEDTTETHIAPAFTEGVLTFAGKNWKLASDKKWKKVSGFLSEEKTPSLGTKQIGQFQYEIHKTSGGFLAFRLN